MPQTSDVHGQFCPRPLSSYIPQHPHQLTGATGTQQLVSLWQAAATLLSLYHYLTEAEALSLQKEE